MIDFGFGAHLGTIDSSSADQMRRWRNDPKIWQWCRQYDLISERDHSGWFSRQGGDATVRMYSVHGKSGFSGVAGLTSIDHINRRAEFSLYTDPSQHRRGLGRAALATLLSHAFQNLNLNLIWGEVFDANPALNLFIKLGFTSDGTRRQFYYRKGEYIDATLISITGDEWKRHSSSYRPH